jgi:hypothetical protein
MIGKVLWAILVAWLMSLCIKFLGRCLAQTDSFKRHMDRKYGFHDED